MPIILGANSAAVASGSNSCRFNTASSSELSRTPGGAGNLKKWTWSSWMKMAPTAANHLYWANSLFSCHSSGNYTEINLNNAGFMDFINVASGAATGRRTATQYFKDPTAWYSVIAVWDSDNGTAGQQMRLYINGTEVTAFSATTNPAGANSIMNEAVETFVASSNGGAPFFDGYMAEICFIDGLALTPTSFGEFDSDTPTIFKPIDVSGLTFGTNGFYLDFKDSSDLGNDAAGSNNYTPAGLTAADQATDTPDNNFCTLNPITPRNTGLTMDDGNCALASTNAQWLGTSATMAVSAGKWYAEWKYITGSGYNMKFGIVGNGGVDIAWLTANVSYGGYSPIGYEYQYNNSGTGYRVNNNSSPAWTNGSFTAADSIIMMAFDIDAGKIWWGRNGTWFNNTGTANPATGTDAATTGISSDDGPFVISCALEANGSTGFTNFGGCSGFALSSEETDGDGFGKFDYEPPSGFFSLCTKNLANYG